MTKRLLTVLGAVATLATGSASAQNGHSFIDAERSAVPYSRAPMAAQRACADVHRLSGGPLTILSADAVAASGQTPAFCRVIALIQPEIRVEIALPAAWNRRLYMRGNGGFAGESLDAPPRLAQRDAALRHGFVAAQTNTGHDAEAEPVASFALNNHQKVVDYTFRAVHETALLAKRVAAFHYERPVAFSYFDGCSTGGRQGLMSAQRFAGDFDGIVVGAPVLNFTHSIMTAVWNARALEKNPIGLDKMKLIADAIDKKCDGADGLADGLIDDPRQCKFDPAVDLPKCAPGSNGGPDCLTAGQIDTLKAIYSGPMAQGKPMFFGQPVGAEKHGTPPFGPTAPESGWTNWIVADKGMSRQLTFGDSFMRYMAFGKHVANYDWRTFDFDKDPAKLAGISRLIDATDPDLSAFRSRGGKILMYFGWADTALTPLMGIDYYERVAAKMGPATRDFYRLFMVPGMFHCRGGVGVDRFDALTPLINWVESGAAPDRLLANRMESGKTVRSRPLCPYPQVARHDGKGSPDEAASFACATP